MHLTPRLALCADMASGGKYIADIGCDHAMLPIALVRRGALRALACDIRPGPLARAKQSIARAELGNVIDTRLCDGLGGVLPGECDTITICGMGGETIAGILRAAPWTACGQHLIVMQPQSRAEALRTFLAESGYGIEAESLAREGNRLYCAIAARGGGGYCGDTRHFLFSQAMTRDPLFLEYIDMLVRRYRRIAQGQAYSGGDAKDALDILRMLEGYRH